MSILLNITTQTDSQQRSTYIEGYILHSDKTPPYISLLTQNTQNENFSPIQSTIIVKFADTNREINIQTTKLNRNKLSHFQRKEQTHKHHKEVIKQEERLFGEEDIRKVFNLFEKNNFR